MANYVNNVLICMGADIDGSVDEVDLPDKLESYWPHDPERGSHEQQYGTRRIDGSVRAVELKGDGTPFMVEIVTTWYPPNQVTRDAIAEHVRKAFKCESIQWIVTDPYDDSAKVLPLTQPETKPKEEPKTVSRTSEQALKDARDAYNAWCDGKPIEWRSNLNGITKWRPYVYGDDDVPSFNETEAYWRLAQENPPEPSRTPQQAMRDARESGAVEAWESGRVVQVTCGHGVWSDYAGDIPNFTNENWHWRPKASEPPKPVALDWRPVKGSEPLEDGTSILVWDGEDWLQDTWPPFDGPNDSISHWAPQPLPPVQP